MRLEEEDLLLLAWCLVYPNLLYTKRAEPPSDYVKYPTIIIMKILTLVAARLVNTTSILGAPSCPMTNDEQGS